MNTPTERHEHLTQRLSAANLAYHNTGESELSDHEYDTLRQELRALEAAHPTLNSGLDVVGAPADIQVMSRTHLTPMLSLGNAYALEDLQKFEAKLSNHLGSSGARQYTMELKIDGLSCNIVYRDGALLWAAPRGNGVEGDDITAQIRMLGLPERVPVQGDLEVRGEIYMPRSHLAHYNAAAREKGEREFKNARNAAVGCLRKGTPERVSLLKFAAYGVGRRPAALDTVTTQAEMLERLRALGFPTAPGTTVVSSMDEAQQAHQALSDRRAELDFDADGTVLKLNRFDLQQEAGLGSLTPHWATAYKFDMPEVSTRLRSVTFTTGRTGKITPVAELEPVDVDGSTVSRATLNNEDFITALGLHEGDTVTLRKAGSVIPEITGVITALREPGSAPVTVPFACPSCHTPLLRRQEASEGGRAQAAHHCVNAECPAQIQARLLYATEKDVLDIQGVREAAVQGLQAAGVRTFDQLYALTEQDIAAVPLGEGRVIGAKNGAKIHAAIQESRSRDLWRFIRALSIPGTGKGTAQRLAEQYASLEELRVAALQPDAVSVFAGIRDIGAFTAGQIVEHLRGEGGRLIQALNGAGVTPTASRALSVGTGLADLKVVVTGTLSLDRSAVETWLRQHGAQVSGSVTKKTTHLLAGAGGGGKAQKAEALGVPALTEAQMAALCAERGLTFLA
ncbi:NAD-dependent DNA ligase LigA [Deinococcus ficus]|uniref:NAD-dependent DNA ligase LigA n=1 Tax=Deinococcus ficus TaxID=317577 RepID=UPI0004165D50|nr:NAD-dependent DNA ligase LigA [Deinococcus ficus]